MCIRDSSSSKNSTGGEQNEIARGPNCIKDNVVTLINDSGKRVGLDEIALMKREGARRSLQKTKFSARADVSQHAERSSNPSLLNAKKIREILAKEYRGFFR